MEANMGATRRWLVLAGLLACVAAPAAAQDPLFSAPKGYVLALGDSLTFGFQQAKFLANPDPANFTTGFVDDFANRLSDTAPGRDVRVVNFGCPGETTSSFLAGPCAYHAFGFSLHDNFAGSQMAAAEAFLAAHRGQVGPILISLGANDILAAVTACGGVNAQCLNAQLPGILAAVAANYEEVLARLRAAAPDAEIIAVALYNPYAVFDAQTNAVTNGLTAIINQEIGILAAGYRVRVADPLAAFDLAPPQPARLCSLTLFCGAGDIHASDAGYQVIADLIWAASGYARFER
jgi:lysophospholipase L1-like esterase